MIISFLIGVVTFLLAISFSISAKKHLLSSWGQDDSITHTFISYIMSFFSYISTGYGLEYYTKEINRTVYFIIYGILVLIECLIPYLIARIKSKKWEKEGVRYFDQLGNPVK